MRRSRVVQAHRAFTDSGNRFAFEAQRELFAQVLGVGREISEAFRAQVHSAEETEGSVRPGRGVLHQFQRQPAHRVARVDFDDGLEAGETLRLKNLLSLAERILAGLSEEFAAGVARYVQTVVALLIQAGIDLSPRRANLLYRNVLAVNAAALALDPNCSATDATLLALRCSLPQAAFGVTVSEIKLLSAHKEAVRTFDLKVSDPLRAILCAINPLERFELAVKATKLPKAEFSRVVADALAQLTHGAREAAVVYLFETGAVGRLNTAIAAQAGELYRDLVAAPTFSETLHASHTRYTTWGRVKDLLSRLNPSDPRAHLPANAIAALFAKKHLQTPQDAEQAFTGFAKTDSQLRQQ